MRLAQVEALASVLSSEQIADYLGVSRTTFYAIMERQPEVSERYKKGRAKALASIARSLLRKAMDGDTTSAIFYLKTQGGWRETHRVDISEAGSQKSLDDFYSDSLQDNS